MKKIIIVGAGGLARMIYSWLPDFLNIDLEWELVGFLSDNPNNLYGYGYEQPIISSVEDFQPKKDEVLVMGISNPKDKLRIAKLLESRGATFINLIHPSAIIGKNVKLGKGCVVCPYVVITCDADIGDFVLLNIGVTVGHDVLIDDGCTINAHSDITGYVQLGRGVFLGSHASITPNVKVNAYARVGAGSVVVKQVGSENTVFGVPAKRV